MRAGKVFMESPDGGEHAWVEATEVHHYTSKGGRVMPTAMPAHGPPGPIRMKLEAPGGPVVREFGSATQANQGSPMTRRHGYMMDYDDTTKSTPGGEGFISNLRAATSGIPQSVVQGMSGRLGGARAISQLGRLGGLSAAADVAGDIIGGRKPSVSRALTTGAASMAWKGVPDALAKGLGKLPQPLMKSAFGNALPGTADLGLKHKVDLSDAGMEKVNAQAKRMTAMAQNAINLSTTKYSYRSLFDAVRGQARKAQKSDVVSEDTEGALADALSVLTKKIGPKSVTTPASVLVAPGRGGLRSTSGSVRPASTTLYPARPMSARDVDDVRKYAQKKAEKFYEARMENNSKVVGPAEEAYLAIAGKAREMLRSNKLVAAANDRATELQRLADAMFASLKRGHSAVPSAVTGVGMGVPAAMMTHNPAAAGVGIPLSVAHYLGTRPSFLSRKANELNDPRVGQAIRSLPRYPAIALPMATGVSRDKRKESQ